MDYSTFKIVVSVLIMVTMGIMMFKVAVVDNMFNDSAVPRNDSGPSQVPKRGEWHKRTVCPDCGWSYRWGFYPEVCGNCGCLRDETWVVVSARRLDSNAEWTCKASDFEFREYPKPSIVKEMPQKCVYCGTNKSGDCNCPSCGAPG